MIQNNITDFNTKKIKYKYNSLAYFLFRIIIRIALLLFLFNFSLLILYIVGNFQKFQTNSQLILLNLLNIISFFTFVFSILSLGLNIYTFFATKRKVSKLIIYIIFYIFTTLFCVVTFVFSRGLLLLVKS